MPGQNKDRLVEVRVSILRGYATLKDLATGRKVYVALLPIVGGRVKYGKKIFSRARDAEHYRIEVMARYRRLKRIEVEKHFTDKRDTEHDEQIHSS